jgi:transposase
MIKSGLSEEDVTALRYWRFQHPDPRVQVRMEALYLRSPGVTNGEILRLWRISNASFPRDLKAYVAGGVEQLKRIDHDRPQRELANYRTTREAYLQQHPPATVAEAAAQIAEVTGMVRQPTQVRQFLRALGMKPMNVGMIPAKADVDAQEAFKKAGSQGYRQLALASAPGFSWMRPPLCSPPFEASSGVSSGSLSKPPRGASG